MANFTKNNIEKMTNKERVDYSNQLLTKSNQLVKQIDEINNKIKEIYKLLEKQQ